MDNRFKKSLDQVESNILDNTLANMSDSIIDNIKTDTSTDVNYNILYNILTDINSKDLRGKNKTFYLSLEVDNALTKTAKKNKISKSKLVDNILKKVLIEEN